MNKHILFFLSGILPMFFFATLPVMAQAPDAIENKKTGVILSIDPPTITATPEEIMTFTVLMDPSAHIVKAFDLALTFDNTQIEIISIEKTPLTDSLTVLSTKIENENGTVFFSLGVPPGDSEASLMQDIGSIVTVTARAKAGGSSSLKFDQNKTIVAAQGEESNVLESSQGSDVSISPTTESAASSDSSSSSSQLIPILVAGTLFCIGLFIFTLLFLRKAKTE